MNARIDKNYIKMFICTNFVKEIFSGTELVGTSNLISGIIMREWGQPQKLDAKIEMQVV